MGELLADLPRRRRGAALEDAICRAAFDELSECGYGDFTIESVAARAQTGKASIYRRWPTKDELLLEAFTRGMPQPVECFIVDQLDNSVTTRDALLQTVRSMVHNATGEKRRAMHAVASEAAREPEFARAVDRLIISPRREGLAETLRRGIGRGEVDPEAPIDAIAELVPAFFFNRLVFRYADVTDDDMLHIVDDIAMPLLERPAKRSTERSEPSGEEQLRDV